MGNLRPQNLVSILRAGNSGTFGQFLLLIAFGNLQGGHNLQRFARAEAFYGCNLLEVAACQQSEVEVVAGHEVVAHFHHVDAARAASKYQCPEFRHSERGDALAESLLARPQLAVKRFYGVVLSLVFV